MIGIFFLRQESIKPQPEKTIRYLFYLKVEEEFLDWTVKVQVMNIDFIKINILF